MPGAKLRVTGGNAAGSVIEIAGELIVGRSAEGEGQLGGDPELSRRHARIFAEPGGGLAVEDLGSTNGTYVNGQRVTGTQPLPPGATLRLGQTDLVVEAAEDAAATQLGGAAPTAIGETPVVSPVPPVPPTPPVPAGGPPAPPVPSVPPAPPSPAMAPPPPPQAAPPPPPAYPAAAPAPAAPAPGAPPPAAPGYPGTPAPAGSGGGNRGRLIVAAIVGLLVIGGAIAAVILLTGGEDEKKKADLPVEGPPALVSAAKAAECTAVTEPSEGADHVGVPPRYKSNPPHSGDHTLAAASDGRYQKAPPIGELVHALEHGRIVMWHKPGDKEVADELLKIGNADPEHMILTPNQTGMEFQVAATAWTHLLGCPEWNDKVPAAIEAFRDAYRDKGPELVP